MKRFITASMCVIAALLYSGLAFSAGVPPTGQTKCYNNTAEITCPATSDQEFYGQDACYAGSTGSRFELIANGLAVKDNATGLTWEIKTGTNSADRYPIDDPGTGQTLVQGYINGLNSSKFADIESWRLPTLDELSSVPNLGKHSPAIYDQFSPDNTKYDYGYWTNTTYAGEFGGISGWAVDFGTGEIYINSKAGTLYVRAVSGSSAPARSFTPDNAANTVKDNNTGLIWQKTAAAAKMTWKDALAYCESLSPKGWRLPNREELRSIVNYEKYNPAVSSDFTAVSGKYWSSTTNDTTLTQAWTVDFTDGAVSAFSKTTTYYVRAVRDTPVSAPDFSRGDINHDTKVDLGDAIDGLRVLDGISVTVYTDTEVNGDSRIGQEEVIYALQVAAGIRTP